MKNKSFFQRTRTMFSLVTGMLWNVGPLYLYRHRMSRCQPMSEKVRCRWLIRKSAGTDSVFLGQFCRDLKEQKGFKRLGWVGYCWGGALAVLLAGENSPLDTSICFHPGTLTVKNFEDIRKPFMLVCSEGAHANPSLSDRSSAS